MFKLRELLGFAIFKITKRRFEVWGNTELDGSSSLKQLIVRRKKVGWGSVDTPGRPSFVGAGT